MGNRARGRLGVMVTVSLAALLAVGAAVAVEPLTETKVVASDGAGGDAFGRSVAVDGDRLVAGADGDASGSVYVFEPDGSGGLTETKLTASDGSQGDQFGGSVAAAGDGVVAGSPFDDDEGTDSGSVYVFEPDGSGGYTETKLTASDGAPNDRFGSSVAAVGDRIVVGSPFDDDGATDSGSVYVFESDGSGGFTETKLTASGGAAFGNLGRSVGAAGGRIVAGAPLDDGEATQSGSVYVFESDGSGGFTETKLAASDGAGGDNFGRSVGAAGGRIVAGAPFDGDQGLLSGSVYVFESDGAGGHAETKLTASDGAVFGTLGNSVAAAGDRIVGGAEGDGAKGPQSGAVYLYTPATPQEAVAALRSVVDGLELDPSEVKLVLFLDRIEQQIDAGDQSDSCRAVDKYLGEIDRLADQRPEDDPLPEETATELRELTMDIHSALDC